MGLGQGYGKIGDCIKPEWDPGTGECTNKDALCQPYYTNGALAGQQVMLDNSAYDIQYIFIYKIQYINYSDEAIDMATITKDYNNLTHSDNEAQYGTRLVDKYTNQSMHLGWINRLTEGQQAEYLDAKPTVYHPNGNTSITWTHDTTLWRDSVQGEGINRYEYTDGTVSSIAPIWVNSGEIWLETTMTANAILAAAPEGDVTSLDAFSFVFFYTPENTNKVKDAVNVSSNPVWLHTETSIKGQIFNDKYDYDSEKITGKVNGQYDSGEDWTSGDNVRVQLYGEDGTLIQETVTNNGNYEFTNLQASNFEYGDIAWTYDYVDNMQEKMTIKKNYAVRFIYNGEKYESTIFNDADDGRTNVSRAVENGDLQGGGNQPWSKCSRKEFNEGIVVNKKSIAANKEANNNINAGVEVGSSTYLEDANSLWITADTTYREHVNLGLITRYFNLSLTSSLENMNVSINGITQPYEGFGNMSKLTARLSSGDVDAIQAAKDGNVTKDGKNQTLAVQKSDYEFTEGKELEVWVNYKVEVTNTSPAYYAKVAKVRVFCDNRFTAIKIGNGPETTLDYSNRNYSSPNIIELSGATLGNEGLVDNTNTINISMKLDRTTIKAIMDAGNTDEINTLNFLAEIGDHTAYYRENPYGKGHVKGELAGKLDENSIPGNFNINEYNANHNMKLEDDTDKALGVRLIKQGENGNSRKITGIVFEDATSQHDEDLRGTKAQNNAKLRYGDGKYIKGGTTPKDKTIKGVKVQLKDETSGKIYEGTSDENGTYTLENIIPSANYTIEFTYGDGETKQYNYQDYKSTIDTSDINYKDSSSKGTDSKGNVIVAKGSENYWYSKAGNNSVAKDKVKKYDWSQSMTYAEAVKLENYNDNSKDISNTAATEKFMVPITEYGKDSSGNAAFTINNMNFGLAEKPRSELTINKVVDHITITTSDGRTLIDGTKGAINSTSWTDRYVQAIVDENLIYGSTLKITYKYYVTNTGEIDFAYIGGNNFYDYGKIGQEGGMIVKTKADKIIDYVDNSLMYDEKMQANPEDANKKNKDYWKTAEDSDLELLGNEAKNGASNINTKLVTTGLSEDLVPGQSTGPIYLTLSKVLSSSENKDKNALTYNNYAEVIKSTNQLGRRSYHTTTNPNNSEKDNYTTKEVKDDNGRITGFQITNKGNDKNILLSDVVNRGAPVTDEKMKQSGNQLVLSIPGDLDMSKLSAGETTLYWEPDSDIDLAGGSVQIVPPFGSQRVIWTIIATVSTIILAIGIILIKKKVLK